MKKEILYISGMHCSNCALNIEESIKKIEGIMEVSVNVFKKSMYVEYNEDIISIEKIILKISNLGYTVILEEKELENVNEDNLKKLKLNSLIGIILLIIIMILSMSGLKLNFLNLTMQLIITIITMYINREYYNNGLKSIKNNLYNMNTLISISTIASFGFSIYSIVIKDFNNIYFESIVMILSLVTLGKFIEEKIKVKAMDKMVNLLNLIPKYTVIEKNGKEYIINTKDVEIDDVVIIKTGDIISVDGKILEGSALVDEASISGESKLISKSINDEVLASSIVKNGYLKVKVEKLLEDTLLSQVMKLVDNASNFKTKISKIADEISKVFVKIIIALSILTYFIWILLGYGYKHALIMAISVLVISCPCALGLASPLSIMIGSYKSAAKGILFKNAISLENLSSSKIFLFDKTGTLTKGKPIVMDYIKYENVDEIDDLIFSIEKKSEHPLSKAIIKYFKNSKEILIDEFIQIEGMGIKALIGNDVYLIGNKKILKENIMEKNISEDFEKFSDEGKTCLFFVKNNKILALISIVDEIREETKVLIDELKENNIESIMLTGDNEKVAKYVSNKLGIKKYYHSLLPTEKYEILSELQKNNKVVMIGDGINDSPSLAKADVSITLSSSIDIAIKLSDIVLLNENLRDILLARKISKKVLNNIRLNFFLAFIYNILAIPIAMGILYKWDIILTPHLAAAAMSISSISVLLSSLFLKNTKID